MTALQATCLIAVGAVGTLVVLTHVCARAIHRREERP